jgi:poly-gamma-glutamate synthesis protein (capsule biosynthesis protein)
VLPHPSAPALFEPWVRDARDYVALAERAHGALSRPVAFSYPWGEALDELGRHTDALRLVNLETSITTCEEPWPGKGIHYRMHPRNVPCLQAAGLDCVCLANNHVLDWGYGGLAETFDTLGRAGIASAGAGSDEAAATTPAVLPLAGGGRLLVFAAGCGDSGIPGAWAATPDRPGVHLLDGAEGAAAATLVARIARERRAGDRVVVSIHWGPNWGHALAPWHRALAHRLVDAGADLVHGHSSHHLRAPEVWHGRLVIYGCGDLLTDYEGIEGIANHRGDLGALWLATLDAAGALLDLRLFVTRMERLQLRRAPAADVEALAAVLTGNGRALGTAMEVDEERRLRLRWA